jgi:hypothetical protein
MKYTHSGGQTAAGPADCFTGTVQIDGIRNPDEQSAVGCAHVRFSPSARTAWHHHPKGETLYITDGIGLVATRTDVHEIRPATSSSRARNTGTARHLTGSWPTWPCKRPTNRARSSPGSTTSPTRTTALDEPDRVPTRPLRDTSSASRTRTAEQHRRLHSDACSSACPRGYASPRPLTG